MERLTKPTNNSGHEWSLLGKNSNLKTIKRRLGKYEGTRLTPDEVIAIQKENTELKELLKLSFEDIRGIVTGMEECELCKNNDVGENIKYCHKHDFDCKNCEVLQICKCGQCKGTNNWQWQHADKLKELGVE